MPQLDFLTLLQFLLIACGCKYYWFHLLGAHNHTHTNTLASNQRSHTRTQLCCCCFFFFLDFSSISLIYFRFLQTCISWHPICIYIFYITHGLPTFIALSHSYSPFMNSSLTIGTVLFRYFRLHPRSFRFALLPLYTPLFILNCFFYLAELIVLNLVAIAAPQAKKSVEMPIQVHGECR